MDRRDFFKKASVASLGLIFTPAVVKVLAETKVEAQIVRESIGIEGTEMVSTVWIYPLTTNQCYTKEFMNVEFEMRKEVDRKLFMGKHG